MFRNALMAFGIHPLTAGPIPAQSVAKAPPPPPYKEVSTLMELSLDFSA